MATSFLKKTMVYLGLVDDEYDEYDDYEDRAPRGFSSVTRVDNGADQTSPTSVSPPHPRGASGRSRATTARRSP